MNSLYPSLILRLSWPQLLCLPLVALAPLAVPATSHAQNVGAMRNSASGQCIDVKAFSQAPEAPVIQWGCTGATNQPWRLVPVSDGYCEIQGINSWQCLDVHWFNTDAGMEVVQFNCTDGANQQFEQRPQHVWSAVTCPSPWPGSRSRPDRSSYALLGPSPNPMDLS